MVKSIFEIQKFKVWKSKSQSKLNQTFRITNPFTTEIIAEKSSLKIGTFQTVEKVDQLVTMVCKQTTVNVFLR